MADNDWKCPNVSRCELFPVMHSQVRLRLYLDRYCYDEYRSCARYRYAKTHGKKPPATLLPSGNELEQSKSAG